MPKRAVVTNTADAFGKGMSGGWVKFLEKSGLPIEIVDRVQFPLGIHDLSAEVARIKAAKPDILFPYKDLIVVKPFQMDGSGAAGGHTQPASFAQYRVDLCSAGKWSFLSK